MDQPGLAIARLYDQQPVLSHASPSLKMTKAVNEQWLEWESHKDIIKELYLVQNLPLSQVRQEMLTNYAFKATLSQVRRKIEEWGFGKRSKPKVWKGVDRALKRRLLDPDNSEVYINGQLVPKKKLKKELSRNVRPTIFKNSDVQSPKTPTEVAIYAVGHPQEFPTISPISLPWFDFVSAFSGAQHRQFGTSILGGHGRPASSSMNRYLSSSAYTKPFFPSYTAAREDQYCDILQCILPNDSPHDTQLHSLTRTESQSSKTRVLKCFEPYLLQSISDDTDDRTKILSHASLNDKTLVFVSHLSFLVSNDLLSEDETDKILLWLTSHWSPSDFKCFFEIHTVTARAVLSHLLHSAIRLNEIEMIKLAIEANVDLEQSLRSFHDGSFGSQTLLQRALLEERVEIAEMLINAGANVDAVYEAITEDDSEEDDWSSTYAEFWGYDRAPTMYPAYIAACHQSTVFLVPPLLSQRAALESKTILDQAIKNGADTTIVQVILNAFAFLAESTFALRLATAIRTAAKYNNIEAVNNLLSQGASADGILNPPIIPFIKAQASRRRLDLDCTSPLVCAIQHGHMEVVDLLLRAEAQIDLSPAGVLDPVGLRSLEEVNEWYDDPFNDQWDDCEIEAKHYRRALCALQAAVLEDEVTLVQRFVKKGAAINTLHGTPPLTLAALNGNLFIVRYLLDKGAAVNATANVGTGMTALVAAAMTDDVGILQTLLEYGADIDQCSAGRGGRTALQQALKYQCDGAVDFLLDAGADIGGSSRLQAFVKRGDIENSTKTLRQGARLDGPDSGAILISAVARGDEALVHLLLAHGSNVEKSVNFGIFKGWLTPLQIAAQQGNEKIARILLDAGAKVDALGSTKGSEGTALQVAVSSKNCQMANFLIKHGADVNVLGHGLYKYSPFGTAIKQKDFEMVSMLLQNGADLNRPAWRSGEGGMYPLSLAIRCNCDEAMIISFLMKGANANFSGSEKKPSPLTHAVFAENFHIVPILLDYGANVNYRPSATVMTPVQAACRNLGLSHIQELIRLGADINAPAPTKPMGRTSLQAAVERGSVEIVTYLLSIAADVNAPAGPDMGVTALQAAAMKGYLRIAQILLEAGADIDADPSPIKGRTAIDGAAENGRLDMVKFLLDSYHGEKSISFLCKRALEFAEWEHQVSVVELLENYKRC